jgi:hypothetical protein
MATQLKIYFSIVGLIESVKLLLEREKKGFMPNNFPEVLSTLMERLLYGTHAKK